LANQGVIEVDLGFDPEAVLIRPQFTVGAVLGHGDRLEHFYIAPRQCACGKAGLVDGVDKRSSTAIHNGDFGSVDLDNDVIDVKSSQGREQVLSRRA
jgi:hypothetical protein